MELLSKNILTTIIYYDILDFPLTSFEIYKYLISQNLEHIEQNNFSLADTIKELDKDEIKKHIEEYWGFYFLKGRKELVEKRIESNKISEKKAKIIKKAVKFLRFVPFVRMVSVTGRMAMKNASKKSDLDLLIALKNKKIFTGRALITFLTHILGRRRYGHKIADRICLNHFMVDDCLKTGLDDLFLSSKDSIALHLFAASEYSFIYPVFGWKTFQKFQKENDWVRSWKINYEPDVISSSKLSGDYWLAKAVRKTGEIILSLNFIENFFKKWQMRRIINDPRTHQMGSFVTAGDKELIFLPCPQGMKIYERFSQNLTNLFNFIK